MSRFPPVFWLVALALLPRLAWVLLKWSQGGPSLAYPDEQLHWDLAVNLVEEFNLVSADGRYVARMPGYPLFLALFAWVGEGGILLARLGQALLGGLAAGVAFEAARTVGGTRAGWVTGLLVAFDPYGVFFSQLLLTEVLFTILALLLTLRCWTLLQSGETTTRPWLLLGVLFATALFVRPAGAAWLGLLIAWLGYACVGWPQRVRRVVLLTLPIVVLLLPWGLRNRSVIGSFAWLSGNGGVTLYDAQGPQADGSSDQTFLQDPKWQGLGEVELDRALYAAARAQMAEDPARVLQLAWVKIARTWNPFPNVQEHRQGATAWISASYTLVCLLLAAIGTWRLLRLQRRAVVLWLLPIVVFTLLHAVFIGSVRYRVPLMPFLALLGGGVAARVEPIAPTESAA